MPPGTQFKVWLIKALRDSPSNQIYNRNLPSWELSLMRRTVKRRQLFISCNEKGPGKDAQRTSAPSGDSGPQTCCNTQVHNPTPSKPCISSPTASPARNASLVPQPSPRQAFPGRDRKVGRNTCRASRSDRRQAKGLPCIHCKFSNFFRPEVSGCDLP